MKTSTQLLLATLLGSHPFLVSAYLTDPPTSADPNTVSDCSNWVVAATGDTCEAIASKNGISVSDFSTVYNPSVGTSCKLKVGDSYCVERNYGVPPPATSTTTSSSTTTSAGNGITTPTPTQPGMTPNCNKFYKVKSGDGCASIASTYKISLSDFYAWNTGVGSNCETLWVDTNYCVGIIGGTPTTLTTTTTSAGNGITTPTPTQPGMTPNCNKFYKAKSGDGCATIASTYKISLSDFYAWNTGVGSNCETLWVDTNYCVGIIGGTPPTTTSAGNGIATPTPIQGGMTPNCNKFHKSKDGDGCAAIAASNKIGLSDFYAWNKGVGPNCESLWVDTYYCIGVIGGTPTTSTPTTTKGNGISTPTPTQPGMTPNCDRFYLIKSGDGCASVAKQFNISLSLFYAWNTGVGSGCETLWANTNVCVHAFK